MSRWLDINQTSAKHSHNSTVQTQIFPQSHSWDTDIPTIPQLRHRHSHNPTAQTQTFPLSHSADTNIPTQDPCHLILAFTLVRHDFFSSNLDYTHMVLLFASSLETSSSSTLGMPELKSQLSPLVKMWMYKPTGGFCCFAAEGIIIPVYYWDVVPFVSQKSIENFSVPESLDVSHSLYVRK